MKTMILCGGTGTRLREETEHRPKPMVEVGGRPIIWHIMRLYAFHGFKEFILCLGYRGDMIKEYFLDFTARNSDFTVKTGKKKSIIYHEACEEQDLMITLANTGVESLTGTRIKLAAKYLDNDDIFMMTYGDGLSDVNLAELVSFHRSHGKLATLTTVRPASRFALMKVDEQNSVSEFKEKPIGSTWSSAGFMVLSKKALDYIPDENCMFEKEPLERLAKDGQLAAYKHDGFFFPMDTYRDYAALNQMWKSRKAPWAVWEGDSSVSSRQ